VPRTQYRFPAGAIALGHLGDRLEHWVCDSFAIEAQSGSTFDHRHVAAPSQAFNRSILIVSLRPEAVEKRVMRRGRGAVLLGHDGRDGGRSIGA